MQYSVIFEVDNAVSSHPDELVHVFDWTIAWFLAWSHKLYLNFKGAMKHKD